ncbi:FAD dependent oxidoreductase [Thermus thermophilus]|nr:FAD dependent oxidoreductase [Thermus thermophilus]
MEWLLQGAEALVGYRPPVASLWRGVRFKLPSFLLPVEGGFALTGLGSTGFLYAPLLAKRLAERL